MFLQYILSSFLIFVNLIRKNKDLPFFFHFKKSPTFFRIFIGHFPIIYLMRFLMRLINEGK